MSADYSSDLEPALQALDRLVEGARPVRFVDQVWVDRESVYEVLDRLRLALPFSIRDLRWLRERRAQDGDPPLGDAPIDSSASDACQKSIDGLDDLVHRAPGFPISDKVRVDRKRFTELAAALSSALEPVARELVYAKGIYGSDLEAARAAADAEAAGEDELDLPPLPELRTSTLTVYRIATLAAVTIALPVTGVLSIRDGSTQSVLVGVFAIATSIYVGARMLSLRRTTRKIRSIGRRDTPTDQR